MKFFSRLLKLIIALSLVVVLGMAAVFLFVDPNQFKNKIEEKVFAQTGHVLTIAGPISWKWDPMLSLQLEKVTLNNQAPFKEKLFSAEVMRADLGMSSLLTGKIFVNLKLNEVDIILERDAKGKANWETLAKAENKIDTESTKPATAEPEPTVIMGTNSEAHTPVASRKILLNSVQIENAKITFHDQAKNTHYQISQLQFSMDNLTNGMTGLTTPVSLSLQLDNLNKQTLGKLNLKADWALNLASDELDIKDIAFTFTFPDGKTTNLTGETRIQHLSHNPTVRGILAGNHVDMKPWLNDLGVTLNPNLPTSADLKLTWHYETPFLTISDLNIQLENNGSFSGNFALDTTKLAKHNMNVQGDFIGKQLKYEAILIDELQGSLSAKAGVIRVEPMDIQIAQSKQHIAIVADLREDLPKFSIQNASDVFEVKHLLAMFGIQNKLEGKTTLKFNMTASGHSADQIKQSLNGHAAIGIEEGKFSGINLIPLLKDLQTSMYTLISSATKKPDFNLKRSAQSLQDLWKKKKTVVDANSSTPFSHFKVSMTAQNGLITSSDLSIEHPEYHVTGQGSINLVTNSLDYQTAVQVKNNPYPASDTVGNYLYSSTLPVSISGTLSDPAIRPDIKTYTNHAVTFAQKNIAEKMVQKAATKAANKLVEQTLDKVGDKLIKDEKVNQVVEGAINSLFEKK